MSYLTLGQLTAQEASGVEPIEYVNDLWQEPASGDVFYEPLPPGGMEAMAPEPEPEPLPLPPQGYLPYVHGTSPSSNAGMWYHPVTNKPYYLPLPAWQGSYFARGF